MDITYQGLAEQVLVIQLCLLEILDTLMHDFEGTVDVSSKELRVNIDERVIHPRLVPLEPVSSSQPQVLERLKLSSQLANPIILWHRQYNKNVSENSKICVYLVIFT